MRLKRTKNLCGSAQQEIQRDVKDEAHMESNENQPSHDEVPSEEPDEESQSPPPRKFCSLTEIYNANFCHVEPEVLKKQVERNHGRKRWRTKFKLSKRTTHGSSQTDLQTKMLLVSNGSTKSSPMHMVPFKETRQD
ncbi:hypothetical protein Tco_1533497 [Tanacetum coccineum]